MKMQHKNPSRKKTTSVSMNRLESFGSTPLDGGFDPDKLSGITSFDAVQQASRPHLDSQHPQVRQQARNYLSDLNGEGYELTGKMEFENGETRTITSEEAHLTLGTLFEKEGIEASQLSKIEYELSKQARGGWFGRCDA